MKNGENRFEGLVVEGVLEPGVYDPVSLGDGRWIHSPFRATLDNPSRTTVVEVVAIVDGPAQARPVVVAVRGRSEGGSVARADLRVPLSSLMRTAWRHAQFAAQDAPRGTRMSERWRGPVERGWAGIFRDSAGLGSVEGADSLPTRRAPYRLTDEFLREIAELYRYAVARGESPWDLIARRKGRARQTVAEWIRFARKKNFLGPAVGTRPGEGEINDTADGDEGTEGGQL